MSFDVNSIHGETGKALKKQPKVAIMIAKEKGRDYWEGGINGYFFTLPYDTVVEVPESIATLIKGSAKVLEQSKEEVKEYTEGKGKKVG